jgi:hypothetical protein
MGFFSIKGKGFKALSNTGETKYLIADVNSLDTVLPVGTVIFDPTKQITYKSDGTLNFEEWDILYSTDSIVLTNDSGSTVTKGKVVFINGNDSFNLALADDLVTSKVFGFVKDEEILNSESGEIQTDGIIRLEDWTSISGTENLTVGSHYFLSQDAAGNITTVAPTQRPGTVVPLGIAKNTKELEISLTNPIVL